MPQRAALVARVLEFAAHMAPGLNSFSAHEGVRAIVAEHLARPETGWALGMVGAVAEFMRAPTERARSDRATCIVTGRGAIRIEASPDTRAVRFTTDRGLGCIALCLPAARARLGGHAVLTEVGRDHGALRPEDRDAFLFDLGVGSPYFDFCVRTADPAAAGRLRQQSGTPLFDDGRALLPEIAAMQPHRIVCSKLGRIEVYQTIALAGGTTPDGPHTHLLPDLLAKRHAFGGDEPIPPGWIPCVHLYLGNLPAHESDASAHPAA